MQNDPTSMKATIAPRPSRAPPMVMAPLSRTAMQTISRPPAAKPSTAPRGPAAVSQPPSAVTQPTPIIEPKASAKKPARPMRRCRVGRFSGAAMPFDPSGCGLIYHSRESTRGVRVLPLRAGAVVACRDNGAR